MIANKLETAVQGLLACLAPPWQVFHVHVHLSYTCTCTYQVSLELFVQHLLYIHTRRDLSSQFLGFLPVPCDRINCTRTLWTVSWISHFITTLEVKEGPRQYINLSLGSRPLSLACICAWKIEYSKATHIFNFSHTCARKWGRPGTEATWILLSSYPRFVPKSRTLLPRALDLNIRTDWLLVRCPDPSVHIKYTYVQRGGGFLHNVMVGDMSGRGNGSEDLLSSLCMCIQGKSLGTRLVDCRNHLVYNKKQYIHKRSLTGDM